MVNACLRAQAQAVPLRPGQLQVVLIGAGATGVELAAELHRTTRTLVSYGLDRIDPDKDIRLMLLEASPRILPAPPERLANSAAELLQSLGLQVRSLVGGNIFIEGYIARIMYVSLYKLHELALHGFWCSRWPG